MHKNILLIIMVIQCLSTGIVRAQQTPYLGLFQENWVLINPAFLDHANIEKDDNTIMVNSSYRQQWLGFDDGPQQMNLRFEHIITTDKRGGWDEPLLKWGLGLTHEKVADFTSTGFLGNFSYFAQLSENMIMGGGFNVGVQSQGLRIQSSQFEDFGADVFAQNLNTKQNIQLDADAGLFFRKIVKNNSRFYHYYGGFSAQLKTARFKNELGSLKDPSPPHLNVLWGCLIKGDQRYGNAYFEPSIWVRYLPGASYLNPIIGKTPLSVDLSVRVHLESQFWFGAGYGTAGNLSAAFGYQHVNNGSGSAKLKGGLMMNVPTSQRSLGYSMEAFLGIALIDYK